MGIIIEGTSVLHFLIGLLYYRPLLFKFVASRLKDNSTTSIPNDISFFFWFEISAVALLLIGILVDWIIRGMHLQLPLTFCVGFLLFAILITFLAPKSGIWLVLIEAIALFVGRQLLV
jgi:hypothetical protein